MTKEQLQGLARLGARQQLLMFERMLANLFREFPGEFASDTAPVLLKPELKAGGNDWPAFVATPAVSETNGNGHPEKNVAISRAWTPERRARQSRVMKKRAKKMAATSVRHRSAAGPWGLFAWQRAHDFLATQDGHKAHTAEILKAANIKTEPSFLSAAKIHPELFKRVGPGVFQLKKVMSVKEREAPEV